VSAQFGGMYTLRTQTPTLIFHRNPRGFAYENDRGRYEKVWESVTHPGELEPSAQNRRYTALSISPTPYRKQKMILKRRMRASQLRPDWLPLFGSLERAGWTAEGRASWGIELDTK